MTTRQLLVHTPCVWLLMTAAVLAAPAEQYIVDTATVVVVCPLTVGGSFEARTASLDGELTAASNGRFDGSLVLDLASLETGIGLRDRHLKENYLEINKRPGFDRAVLEEISVGRATGTGPFTAVLTLRGRTRPVTGTVTVKDTGGRVKVTAEFPVRLADFGIADPTYLGVGVAGQVRVQVQLSMTHPFAGG